jgi:hypothetical protein
MRRSSQIVLEIAGLLRQAEIVQVKFCAKAETALVRFGDQALVSTCGRIHRITCFN